MNLTKGEKILQAIINKAWEDSDFKQELIANPRQVIENFSGEPLTLPKNKAIIIQDQTDESAIYITLPPPTCMDDMELDDVQMEIVAGGGMTNPGLRTDATALYGTD
jgi:hypothetical protein